MVKKRGGSVRHNTHIETFVILLVVVIAGGALMYLWMGDVGPGKSPQGVLEFGKITHERQLVDRFIQNQEELMGDLAIASTKGDACALLYRPSRSSWFSERVPKGFFYRVQERMERFSGDLFIIAIDDARNPTVSGGGRGVCPDALEWRNTVVEAL